MVLSVSYFPDRSLCKCQNDHLNWWIWFSEETSWFSTWKSLSSTTTSRQYDPKATTIFSLFWTFTCSVDGIVSWTEWKESNLMWFSIDICSLLKEIKHKEINLLIMSLFSLYCCFIYIILSKLRDFICKCCPNVGKLQWKIEEKFPGISLVNLRPMILDFDYYQDRLKCKQRLPNWHKLIVFQFWHISMHVYSVWRSRRDWYHSIERVVRILPEQYLYFCWCISGGINGTSLLIIGFLNSFLFIL